MSCKGYEEAKAWMLKVVAAAVEQCAENDMGMTMCYEMPEFEAERIWDDAEAMCVGSGENGFVISHAIFLQGQDEDKVGLNYIRMSPRQAVFLRDALTVYLDRYAKPEKTS